MKLVEGPRAEEVLRDDSWSILPWVIAFVGAFTTICLAIPHLRKICSHSPSKQRRYYLEICFMPLVFSTTAALIVIFVRTHVIWECFQHFAEAVAVHALGKLILARLGDPEEVAMHFKHQGEKRFFQTPPICCVLFCLPKHEFGPRSMRIVRLLTKQFMIVVPLLSICLVTMAYTGLDRFTRVVQLIRLTNFLSMFTALYGLFVVWKATRSELKHFHTGLKFVVLKLVILFGVGQPYLFNFIYWLGAFKPVGLYTPEVLSLVINYVVLAVESPLLYLMITYAYPASELGDFDDKRKPDASCHIALNHSEGKLPHDV